MITAGVDLAAEPRRTAIATIDWSDATASLTSLHVGADDAEILDVAGEVEKLGIDCPLGWPEEYLQLLTAHSTGHVVAPSDVAGKDWRRRLAYRGTDRAVKAATGLTPLSVAADRIGLTAMRTAGLLASLANRGRPVDRAGSGIVVEVYPAASLHCWKLRSRGYKTRSKLAHLAQLVETLQDAAPWLNLGDYTSLCSTNDDAFDAVVAALTSRAAALSFVSSPTDEQERDLARTEGWIALPTRPLSALVNSEPSRP